jgi:predicted small secreted protein
VKTTFKNLLTIALSALFVLSLAAGCATLEGAGEDIESAGESVQDAADGE